MSLMFRIAVAANARGTHHKLAMHGLERLTNADCTGWQNLFLVHAETYCIGSKIPDDKFKDFKNHVLHPRDKYWGGAVDAARAWYATLVTRLKAGAWPEAISAAGILSHYLADPLHPFHTAQSDAENTIHRACEWSINRSYDALYAQGLAARPDYVRQLGRDANWLARLQCESADLANAHYEKLIAHYDITRGVSDPPAGLDVIARKICADLLVTAAATIAAVLDHAIADAGVPPPAASPTLPALLAALKIPQNQFLKRIENTADRRAVQAIYDELRTKGAVVAALPEENRTVRDLYQTEVASLKTKPNIAKLFPLPAETVPYTLPTAVKVVPEKTSETTPALTLVAPPTKAAAPAPRRHAAPVVAPAAAPIIENAAIENPQPALSATPVAVPTTAKPQPSEPKEQQANTPQRKTSLYDVVRPAPQQRTEHTAPPRAHLTLDADVVDAPSIGPKTAERLYVHGIKTIADLLAADPGALSELVDQRHINAAAIRDWQDQTRLVLAVPGLTGGAAQLFVGAGYRTPKALAAADSAKVCATVLAFATSPDGSRLLRDGIAPDAAKITAWHARAQSAKAA
jgi:predicted flap endonuclease-1-like 5' DNA nuclease